MSTIKTNAILDASGGNTTTINGTTPTAYNTMGKNLIINGDMRIAQRATSVSSITAFGYFALDRWREDHYNSGTWTQSQDTDVPTGQGFSNSLKMQCTTAQSPLAVDARLSQTYRIEGQDLQYLRYGSSNAESVTLSFWIKTNKTGTYVITLLDIDNGKLINSQYTVSSANTWEKKTLTFSGNTLNNYDNDNNPSLQIEMWFGAGTNFTTGSIQSSWTTSVATDRAAGLTVNLADNTANYLNITGVQLEVGSVATEFERRPYGTELALCQRYYCKTFNIGTTPANNAATEGAFMLGRLSTGDYEPSVTWRYPVEMRVGPTITLYNPESGTSGQWSAGGGTTSSNARSLFIGTSSAVIDNTDVAITGAYGWRIQATASAEL